MTERNDGFKTITPQFGFAGRGRGHVSRSNVGSTPVHVVSGYNSEPAWNPNSNALKHPGYKDIYSMLTYKRPHGSVEEIAFADKYLGPLNPTRFLSPDTKAVAAYGIKIMKPDGSAPTTLFSSHVDTVHREGGRQIPVYRDGWLYKVDSGPLGADDAAGVWLMLQMIAAKVPGMYLFHRGEERGGIGSGIMARRHEEMLKEYKRAIAFDRRSTHSIITKQGGTRTASDKFATSLAEQLNRHIDLDYAFFVPDDTGSFTDTKNYVSIIDDCTNISAGYDREHSSSERLCLDYLFALKEACLKVDWENIETEPFERSKGYGHGWGFGFDIDSVMWDRYSSKKPAPPPLTNQPQSGQGKKARRKAEKKSLGFDPRLLEPGTMTVRALNGMSFSSIRDWVNKADSYDVVEILTTLMWRLKKAEEQLEDAEKLIDVHQERIKKMTKPQEQRSETCVLMLPRDKDIPEHAFRQSLTEEEDDVILGMEAGLTGGLITPLE